MTDTYTFIREYDFPNTGATGNIIHQTEATDWTELADEFLCFLKGCGYQVDRAALCDYYMDPEPDNDSL
jgi:hypothetical protein